MSEGDLYEIIGKFYRDELDKTTIQTRDIEIMEFKNVVDVATCFDDPEPAELADDQFAEIVRFMREKEPGATADRIFERSRKMLRSPEGKLFGKKSRVNVSRTIENVLAARLKKDRRDYRRMVKKREREERERIREEEERMREEEERMQQVTERVDKKGQDKTVRFSSNLRYEL
jgi:hypothetical protein